MISHVQLLESNWVQKSMMCHCAEESLAHINTSKEQDKSSGNTTKELKRKVRLLSYRPWRFTASGAI